MIYLIIAIISIIAGLLGTYAGAEGTKKELEVTEKFSGGVRRPLKIIKLK